MPAVGGYYESFREQGLGLAVKHVGELFRDQPAQGGDGGLGFVFRGRPKRVLPGQGGLQVLERGCIQRGQRGFFGDHPTDDAAGQFGRFHEPPAQVRHFAGRTRGSSILFGEPEADPVGVARGGEDALGGDGLALGPKARPFFIRDAAGQ